MRALPDGARLLFGGFGARDFRVRLLESGLTLACGRLARGLGSALTRRLLALLPVTLGLAAATTRWFLTRVGDRRPVRP